MSRNTEHFFPRVYVHEYKLQDATKTENIDSSVEQHI